MLVDCNRVTKTKKISKTSDKSIIEQRTFFWRKSFRSSHEMLESSGKFEMFSHGQPWPPQHRGGNFSRTNKTLWIMNYTWGRLRTSTSYLRFLVAIFPGFPPFFSIPDDVPLEVRRKILQIRNASNHLILNNSNSTAVGSWWVLSWTGAGLLSRAGNAGPQSFYNHGESPY